MSRPRLLDLFSGAGGSAAGYVRAGFDVVGVDIRPQPHYLLSGASEFHQADALTFPLDGFDAIHASPPCQDHSVLSALNAPTGTGWLLPETRERLAVLDVPYVIENVQGAKMPNAMLLCGSMFGLRTETAAHGEVWLKRHRLFWSSLLLMLPGACQCYGKLTVPVYGGGAGGNRVNMRGPGVARAGREVMGIDWMTRDELDEAIPPAYTEWIGAQLLRALESAA